MPRTWPQDEDFFPAGRALLRHPRRHLGHVAVVGIDDVVPIIKVSDLFDISFPAGGGECGICIPVHNRPDILG